MTRRPHEPIRHRPPPGGAQPHPRAALQPDRDRLDRPGHRRQHRGLHAARSGRAARTAGGAARRAGAALVEGHRILRRRPRQRDGAVVADVSRSPRSPGRRRRAVRPGVALVPRRARRPHRARRGRAGLGQLLRGPRAHAGGGPAVHGRRRRHAERVAGRGPGLRLLAAPILRPSRRDRPGRHRQRTSADRGRRGPARLLRPRAADAGRGVRAAHDAAADGSAVAEARRPPLPLGAGLRPARRRHDDRHAARPPRSALRDAARGRGHRPGVQRRLGGNAPRLPGWPPDGAPGTAGPGHPARVARPAAAAADGRGVRRAADRLRQRRQPADCPRRLAAARAGPPRGPGCRPGPAGVADAGRGAAPRRRRQRGRPGAGRVGRLRSSSRRSPRPTWRSRCRSPRMDASSRSRSPSPR